MAKLTGYDKINEWLKPMNGLYKDVKIVGKTTNYFQALKEIKKYYMNAYDFMYAAHCKDEGIMFLPYAFDWITILNEVEFEVWCEIRTVGRVAMYPQYPALNYHLDFGNPFKKIAIEVDGKAYHDLNKDLHRDTILKEHGWTVIRIKASEVYNSMKPQNDIVDDYYDGYNDDYLSKVSKYLNTTSDGIMQAIKVMFFGGTIPDREVYHDWYMNEYEKIIYDHTLIH